MKVKDLLKKVIGDKKEYRDMVKRVKALPDDYQFVYEKIQGYMWKFAGGGDGLDILRVQYDLIDLFEESAAEGKDVLDVTGKDVAAFCDELLRNTKTYAEQWRTALNSDIVKKLEK